MPSSPCASAAARVPPACSRSSDMKRARVDSPPPCGEGLGVGGTPALDIRDSPHPVPPPQGGRGRCGALSAPLPAFEIIRRASMDLRFSPEENAFRQELRTFFRSAVPETIRKKVMESLHLSKAEMVASHKILHAKGLTVPHWPREWGGADWTPVQHYIYTEELQYNGVPQPLPFNVSMCGPVVIAFGTEAQKKRFLPPMASLDHWWCQGFSEPGAGSDLASLKTTAVRTGSPGGDHYVVNGQKTWTTLAQHADWIFMLVRTDPAAKKQLGISFLLIDMRTPGITVRPIQTIDGGREVNEVFFDDVKVPVENLVGQENRGWDCAKFLLGNERTGIARV